MKITHGLIKSLKPQAKDTVQYKDNLEIRVAKTGRIAIDYRYKVGGKVHRFALMRLRSYDLPIIPGVITQANKLYQKVRAVHGMGYSVVDAIAEMEEQDAYHAKLKANQPRLRDAADAYLEYFKAEKKSFTSERAVMKYLVAELGDEDPRLIRRHQLQRVIDKHRTKHPTTARHIGKLCSRFWGWMARRGYVDSREQARDLDKPAGTVRSRLFTEDELKDLLGPDAPLIVVAIAYNPLRRAEICRLHWDNVEIVDGDHWVTVEVKGGKLFRTYLSPQFLSCVKTESGYMFRGRHGVNSGEPMKPNSLSGVMKDHREAVGVHDATLHDFRTAFFSWAEGVGVSERAADSVLAHSRHGIMRAYGHSDMAVLKKNALNRWADHLDEVRAR